MHTHDVMPVCWASFLPTQIAHWNCQLGRELVCTSWWRNVPWPKGKKVDISFFCFLSYFLSVVRMKMQLSAWMPFNGQKSCISLLCWWYDESSRICTSFVCFSFTFFFIIIDSLYWFGCIEASNFVVKWFGIHWTPLENAIDLKPMLFIVLQDKVGIRSTQLVFETSFVFSCLLSIIWKIWVIWQVVCENIFIFIFWYQLSVHLLSYKFTSLMNRKWVNWSQLIGRRANRMR